MYLWGDSCEVFEVAADAVGFFDDGVHAQLGDLVDKRVLVAFPVLHHCGQRSENSSDSVLDKTLLQIHSSLQKGIFFFFYRGPSCA